MRLGVLTAITSFLCGLSLVAEAQIVVPGGGADIDRGSLVKRLAGADVVILGEVHDNPDHHANQAWLVGQLKPSALVAEMLKQSDTTPIRRYLDGGGDWDGLAAVVDWEKSGWPDWGMYKPIFEALGRGGVIAGAGLPRSVVRRVMTEDAADLIEDARFRPALRRAMAPELQAELEDEMIESHCGHLPREMAPMMVSAQRLRDANLAAVILKVTEHWSGQVVVITGNGHARKDRGIPAFLAEVAPQLKVVSIGQLETEAGTPPGAEVFDFAWLGAPHPRTDPCEQLRKRVKSKG